MPIHLPAISRRQFLARSLAAGGCLAFGGKLFAASKRLDRNTWALLSDTHLSGNTAQVCRAVNMTEHFKSVSDELLSLPHRPAGVFIMGDCAFNSGELNDYGLFADFLKPIRQGQMPVHLALGNHDNRERFWEVLHEQKAAKRPLADRQVALLTTPRANWFILDSLETTLSTPGLLGHEQLNWLARELDARPRKPALVLLHHNPWLNGNMGLKDTPALLEVIRPRRQVKAYIYGHTHNWKVEQDSSDIHLINLPPVAYVFREGDPSGWVHATVARDGMRLELRCLDKSHKAHGQTVDLKWRA